MGIELLQEASNVAALQQMYRTMGLNWQMGGGVPPPPPPPSVSPFSSLDLYYRQAAAAHSLQRPFPYKMLPSGASGTPLPPTHPSPLLPLTPLSHLSHSPIGSPLAPLSLPTASSMLQEMSSDVLKSSPPPPSHSPISLTRPVSVSPPRQSPPLARPASIPPSSTSPD